MRRLAYAMAFLLVIGLAAAGMFTRSRRPDGKALLISAAQAMEAANSVHWLLHGTNNDPNSPSGLAMMSQPAEIWVGRRAAAMHVIGPNGVPLMAAGINLDTNEDWDYSAETGVRNSGDLTPVAKQAAGIMDKVCDLYLSGPMGPMQLITKITLTQVQESVTTEVRDGREIAVVTQTGILKTSPRVVRERDVFQIDRETNHLLGMQRYVQAEGSDEQLVQTVEQATYNVPIPADLAPDDAVRKSATVSIQESDKYISLVMSADGKEICRTDAPR